MLTIDDDQALRALEGLQREIGGELVGGKLYPLADQLASLATAPAADAAVEAGKRWHVVQSEPQQQKLASLRLAKHFEVYVPMELRTINAGRGKTRAAICSMFGSYFFARFDPLRDHWERIFATPGVYGMLMLGTMPAAVPDTKLDLVRRTEERLRMPLQPGKLRLSSGIVVGAGDEVQVTDADSAFAGWLAKIETIDDEQRIVVLLSLFGREVRTVASARQIAATA